MRIDNRKVNAQAKIEANIIPGKKLDIDTKTAVITIV